MVITLGLDHCLYLMDESAFAQEAQRLNGLRREDPEARAYVRVFFAKASIESVDTQGRISIPGHLRETIGLGREVVLAGSMNRAEIWERGAYDAYQAQAQNNYEEIAKTVFRA